MAPTPATGPAPATAPTPTPAPGDAGSEAAFSRGRGIRGGLQQRLRDQTRPSAGDVAQDVTRSPVSTGDDDFAARAASSATSSAVST